MKKLQIKKGKLNNSYESEPSSGSGSSLGEHHDYAVSDDENMHLSYLLKPPSYQNEITIETTNPDSPQDQNEPKLVGTKQERDLRYGLSEDSSPESPFIGFGESPFGKLKKRLYNYNTPLTKQTSIATPQEQLKPPQPHLLAPVVVGPSPGKLLFANFYDIIVEENSCNAVDVILSNELVDSQVMCSGSTNSNGPFSELSFNGKIKSMCNADQDMLENSAPLHQPLTIAAQRLPTSLETTLNSSYMSESSFVLKKYTNEKSPDLFGDDDDEDADDNADETHLKAEVQPPIYTFDDVIEEVCGKQLQQEQSTNKSFNCPTESSFADEQTVEVNEHTQQSDSQSLFRANCKREKELLQRIRTCLSGVPPPPTMTIPQMDIITEVLKRKHDILNFHKKECSLSSINSSRNSYAGSLLKPTHSLEETQSMAWRDILSVRQHGLSFNLSKASERNEYLSLSVIDRFVGAETASSYQLSPSSAKKRNLRLKMLTASPGNRLSHLAKRRAIFSSANLATTSQKSTSSLGTQILLDKKKPKNRRKGTPKRKTPASKKKNVRKTPSSSARKRLYRCDLIKPGPSRESSKRALFQSPAKTLQPQRYCLPKPTIKPEIATRVEKSKRALFSPDKLSQFSSHSSNNLHFGGESSNSSHAYPSASAFSTASSSTQQLESLLQKRKRHRADDDDEDDAAVLAAAQNSKIFRGGMHSLTPRALQIKSQSFCIGAGSSAQSRSHNSLSGDASALEHGQGLQRGLSSSQMLLQSRNNSSLLSAPSAKLLRAQSENAKMTTNSLTENQRKKLLWAVSQALQEKKITAKHESFKEYASVLARVVRRIFQEYYQKGNASNSETMLRLAKKYAYNVIAGKNVDDIYFNAKAQIDDNKRKSCSRLSGYIAPEEYENRKISQQKLSQKTFNGSMQNIFGMENSMDCLSMSISQTSSIVVSTTLSSITASLEASMVEQRLEQVSQTEVMHNSGHSTDSQDLTITSIKEQQQQSIKLPIEPNPTLQKSSSKNNLCGLALRENVDCELRRSAQKNFTGKDQRNVSPFSAGGAPIRFSSAVKLQSNVIHDLFVSTAAKAKRQISFDS